jgi:kynurenine formamidase
MADDNPNTAYGEWLDELAREAPFGRRDRRGSANHIDGAARRRAADSIRTGRCTSLACPLSISDDDSPAEGILMVDVSRRETTQGRGGHDITGGVLNSASDVLHVAAHGQRKTHLDGLNHYGRRGEWYSGFPVDDRDGPSIADLAGHTLFTRGVLVDIPAVRGTPWVDADEPVTGADIERGVEATGVDFQPGDALLLYMGRDRYEAAGHRFDLMGAARMPGAGEGAARWIASHRVSMLCWDFLDGATANSPSIPVHLLIWAIGLLLVDNCDFGAALAAARESGSAAGGLVVAPPPLPEATGCLVNPLFIQ